MTGLILAVLCWGALHSWLASPQAKDLARRRLGERFMCFYRLAYNLFAGLSFLPVLALVIWLPDRPLYRLPLPWAGLMVAGQVLALVALTAGFLQSDPAEFLGLRQITGGCQRNDPLAARGGELIVSGLYRHVRHPLYTAGLAFLWLLPVMTVNLLALNLALTIYIVIGAFFEERKLVAEFGEQYLRYRAATPMFVPFLKRRPRPASSPPDTSDR
ncbi:MAG: isoprenylcysteine carboxylmethyltransferase family protein [Anaerolineales bacterium]